MKLNGRVWKFNDNIDTDVIIPASFLNTSDREELGRHCFAYLRPDFTRNVKTGDIIVAGRNFGCGSSREHAPLALKEAGVRLIIAKSFARIFYRNAFNIGLPLLESEEVQDRVSEGDRISVDMLSGEITGGSLEKALFARPIPDFMMEIVRSGGLVKYIKEKGTF